MKLSDLWPGHKPPARNPANPVVSVTVTKRAGADQPVATGNAPKLAEAHPRLVGPRELPETLEACEALHEQLVSDAIRLELALSQAQEGAVQGRPYDRSWYNRAKAALKHINRDRQRLVQHMRALRVEERRNCPAWQARDKAILRELNARVSKELYDECVRVVDEGLEVIR